MDLPYVKIQHMDFTHNYDYECIMNLPIQLNDNQNRPWLANVADAWLPWPVICFIQPLVYLYLMPNEQVFSFHSQYK